MRRQPLIRFVPQKGYNDGVNPLSSAPDIWAAGSRGQLLLGEGVIRPWKGLSMIGSPGSGARIMVQLGDTWGGLADYAGPVTASGSLIRDFSNNLYMIGSGKARYENSDIQSSAVNLTASTLLKVATGYISNTNYTYFDQAGLAQPAAPSIAASSSIGAGYTGLISGAMSFKVAAIRNRAMTGSNITDVTAASKSIASTTSAVVTVTNNTIKITFPTAVTGQTHWAVFATKQGFGGTGVHYRIGYRTSSDASAQWIWGIPETAVAAASRVLEFDFKDGDLYPEEAWLFDYPPPAGTHYVRLNNVGIVFGCYAGTIAAVSLPNYFESYNPKHLLYFPEPVTAVLHRQVDDFAYVACRNSIHIVQYIGFRGDDLPSATVQTIIPDIGIAKQCNWAYGAGLIAAWIEGAGAVLIDSDGKVNYEFGKEISRFTSTWDTNTVVSFNTASRSFVFSNGNSSVSFCLQSAAWSMPHYNSDAGVTGNALAAINTRGQLVMSLDNGGTHTAYTYDSGASRMPTAFISGWVSPQNARGFNLYEVEAAVSQGANTENLVIGVHRNLFTPSLPSVAMTSGGNAVTAPAGTFTASWTGKQMAVFGVGIGGAVNFIIGSVTYVNSSTVTLSNISTGSALNAQATLSGMFALVGDDFFTETPTVNVDQHLFNDYPNLQDCRSFCISVWQATDAVRGGVLEVNTHGTLQERSELANV